MSVESKGDAWLLVVFDESLLSGASVARILTRVMASADASWLALEDFEGSGDALPSMSAALALGEPFRVRQAVDLIESLCQVDWGSFVGFRSRVLCQESVGRSWGATLEACCVALRCVDSSMFYVYGTDQGVLGRLRATLPFTEEYSGFADELPYPV